MGRASASITVPGRASEVEALWYDASRWPSWIDGFGHLIEIDGDWPDRGATVTWESPPGGRGRVHERVIAYESRVGQTLEVVDARLTGRQQVAFEPRTGETGITLSLEYELRQRGLLTPVVDGLFIRRAVADSLRRTLARFSIERKAEIQFG